MKSSSQLSGDLLTLGFRVLSDPLRLQILDHLCDRELCVCDSCDRLDSPQSKISFHLKLLKEAQLIHPRQDGRWIDYRLNLTQIQKLE
ncbi:ArsR/SmtB family transcription factor [Baaleninema sp.]|uniref:ArsR/SmtB family transcription factor n=1 Tax=Baaleninema sp. TaxID=3101197 RepID=UPI003CFEA697